MPNPDPDTIRPLQQQLAALCQVSGLSLREQNVALSATLAWVAGREIAETPANGARVLCATIEALSNATTMSAAIWKSKLAQAAQAQAGAEVAAAAARANAQVTP